MTASPDRDSPAAEPPRARRPLRALTRWLLMGLVLFALLLVAFLSWLLFSDGGTRWLGAFVERQTAGRLVLDELTGRLGRVACVEQLRWQDGGLHVEVDSLCLSVSLPALLFDDQLRVTLLRADQVQLTLPAPAEDAVEQPPAALLPRLELPLPLLLTDARVERLLIDDRQIDELQLGGAIADRRLSVSALSLRLDQLQLTLDGGLAMTGDQRLAVNGSLVHPDFELNLAGAGTPGDLALAVQLVEPRPAALRGSVDLTRIELPWQLSAVLPPQVVELGSGDRPRLSVELSARGDRNGYRFDGRAGLAGHPSGSWFNTAVGSGDWQSVAGNVEVSHADARIAGPVRARWLPALEAEVELQARSRRPDWPARLALDARWGDQQLVVKRLRALLADGEVSANATLTGLTTSGLKETAQLAGRVRFDRFDLAALPTGLELGGRLSGELAVDGPWQMPRLEGELRWPQARLSDLSAEAVELTLAGGARDARDAVLRLAGLARAGEPLGEVRARASGGALRYPWQGDLSLSWQQQPRSLELEAALEVQAAAITGTLTALEANDPRLRQWRLDAPADFRASVPPAPGRPGDWLAGARLADGCFSADGGASLCVDLDGAEDRVSWRLDELALRWPVGPAGGELAGRVAASGRFEALTATPVGSARLGVTAAALRLADPPLDYAVGDFEARLELTPDRLQLRADHAGSSLVTLDARAEAAGRTLQTPLDGRFELGLTDLAVLEPLLPVTLAAPRGDLSLQGDVAGTLEAPQIALRASWQAGALAVPPLGLALSDVDARMTARDRVEGEVSLRSGDGTVRVEVTSPLPLARLAEAGRSYGVAVLFDGATLVNLPEYEGTASGHLDLQRQPELLTVAGALEVGPARVTINRVPETSETPSADVVIVDAEPADRLDRRVDVAVSFGAGVRVEGFGLATGVRGRLRVRESPGGVPRVTGNLDLTDGVFEGYGQSFVIERGRLIFDGPVDNPQLDIIAVKAVDAPDGNYQVRLHVTGPVDAVVTRISAEPAVPEADALSLLLTGQRLANASERERISMSAAAAALGIKGASAVGERLGSSLGLDEMIIEGGEDSLVVGAGLALGNDVHLRYTYDVFSRLGGVLLTYALSDKLALEARTGDAHSIHLRYQIDR